MADQLYMSPVDQRVRNPLSSMSSVGRQLKRKTTA